MNLTLVREFLLQKLGLNFSSNQEKELHAKLSNAAKAFGFDITDDFVNWLLKQEADDKLIEKLATFLTIGETYFFREQKALNFLEFEYLPALINKNINKSKRIRIWSAGCASGEEPYTIAIILKRIIPNIENWDITILATDINTDFLNKAKKGIYTKWSFRGISESIKTKYFKELDDNKYAINSEIKNMVKFSYLNLATDSYPSLSNQTNAFDIILCRNVLIYFSLEGTIAVTNKLYNSLVDNGVLLVSPVEASNFIDNKFYRLQYKGISIYQKNPKELSNAKKPVIDNTLFDKLLKKQELTKLKKTNKDLIKTKEFLKQPLKIEKTKNEALPIKKSFILKQDDEKKSIFEKSIKLYKQGLYDEAENLIEENLEYETKNKKELILLLARIKANKGLLVESEKLCLRAIDSDKVDEEAYYLLATIQSELGKTNEAIESLNKTLFLNPDFSLGHFLLGNILMNQGNKAECKKHFKNTLSSLEKLKPDELIVESDGITVNRIKEIIKSYNI